jgi:hypothetical protein
MGRNVVVWGNCQAEPLARLLRRPLSLEGLDVVVVPPVFLVDEVGLDHVRAIVATSALLVSQPVRDEYRIPGCGTAQLAGLLPADGRLVTYPSIFHVGSYPYQVNAHGGDGERVPAPLTDYHDLRTLVAAERGLGVPEALAWWPAPSADAVRAVAADSTRRLREREANLDVAVSTLLDAPDALWTLDHPSNAVLGPLSQAVLGVVGVDRAIEVPAREFLGARRAPLEPAVVAAHGWPADASRPDWRINGRDVPSAEVLAAHLSLYAERPDVVRDARTRYADRLAVLAL